MLWEVVALEAVAVRVMAVTGVVVVAAVPLHVKAPPPSVLKLHFPDALKLRPTH